MIRRWQLLEPPPFTFFEEHPELPRPVATLLYHRGLKTQGEIDEFLHPDYSEDIHDPFLFRDMRRAVDRLYTAIKNEERVIVYGDYDADGVTASVILTSLFKALGYANFDVYLPHRETEGYGLNENAVRALAEAQAKVIITCDCGVSNRAEIALANKLGCDVIVTDHHTVPSELPPAYAIIHPKAPGETYPDQTLSGGGVAFKLTQGMLAEHGKTNDRLPNGDRHEAFEKWLLDLVAISSVADMVPLLGESRTLTKYGLKVLNKTRRIGLQKLLLEARLMDGETGAMKRELDADTIGFHIAPRINAAGRMNHANVAYKLLAAEDPTEAIDLAFELNQNNSERQRQTEEFVAEAREQIERELTMNAPGGMAAAGSNANRNSLAEPAVLFALSERWPTGIIGLIASRLKDAYGKPAIVMTRKGEEVTGSGRSVGGFSLINALQAMPEFFSKFGGHPMACGFTLGNPAHLEPFKTKLSQMFLAAVKGADLTPALQIDAQIKLEEIDWELYDILDQFKPFGQGNRRPRYLAEKLKVVKLEPVGKEKKHLRFLLAGLSGKIKKAIGWNLCGNGNGRGQAIGHGNDSRRPEAGCIDWSRALKTGDTIDIVYEVEVDEWNGNRELQLTIVDLRESTVPNS